MKAAETLLKVLPCEGSGLPLHAHARSREIEQRARSALPPHTLMRRAGLAVARLALAVQPHARDVWIACGPGNNGGDGLQAAAELKAAGRRVRVSLLGDPARLPDDARDALENARQAGVAIEPGLARPEACDLAIDALLGLGSRRAPEGAIAEGIRSLNNGDAPVLAVDLPTGLDAEHGRLLGAQAMRAQHTLSLLTLKPGLFTGVGRDHSGCVWLDKLGVDDASPPDAWLWGAADAESTLRPRRHSQHKGSFGDVVVIGGAQGMTGAAWLAGSAALASGAGRVFVDPLAGAETAPPLLELMCRPGLAAHSPQMLESSTVACGCGGGEAVEALLPLVIERSGRLVLDADALNRLAARPDLKTQLAERRARGLATILTPHPLEAARLLGCTSAEVQADRLGTAQVLADELQAVILLKGSGTVCAAPQAPPILNPTGNSLLSTAGTGDVLAGWCAGLWAQQPAPDDVVRQAHAIAASAAWWHGRAADVAALAGRRSPLTASRLVEAMARL